MCQFNCDSVQRWGRGSGWGWRTLGLLEDTLLYAGLQGLVEDGVEHVLGQGDVVVRLDVLLELLTAVRMQS